MRAKTLTLRLSDFTFPAVEFSPDELVEILPRFALPGKVVDEIAAAATAMNVEEFSLLLTKHQIVRWTLKAPDGAPIPLPRDDPSLFGQDILVGATSFIGAVVASLQTGAETITITLATGVEIRCRADALGNIRPIINTETDSKKEITGA